MEKLLIIFSIFLLSGCISPKRVQTDYNNAAANDKRAESARERGSLREAEYYEREADKLREHDDSAVVIGIIADKLIKPKKKASNDGVWK